VRAFEANAERRGCSVFYLETFNFQALGLYRSLGYEVTYEHAVCPHGIVRYVMVRAIPGP
jgi:ribosomal protein S18 acetylase RimI-like enzyme